ncbi:hypothetical protein HCB45_13015 [Listeria sp. FSL L7-0091]|uniref:hypothetical protein n=1 Tax=Listeria farberi TaxID=2713500 RepID=UPI0016280554|nr:hypothetical protein [Listeria farberi]MBC2262502.1 hypothetical protein [Listeria farberi]
MAEEVAYELREVTGDGSYTPSSLVTQSELDLITGEIHLYAEISDGNVILEQEESVDVSGIGHLRNLSSLTIDEYGVVGGWSEITTLANLTQLHFVDCWNIEEQELSQLTNLPNLTDLGIYNTYEELLGISDVSSLAGLTNLTNLLLEGNQIKDISPLAGLTSTRINATNQKVIDSVKWTPLVEVANEITGMSGQLETPSSIFFRGLFLTIYYLIVKRQVITTSF